MFFTTRTATPLSLAEVLNADHSLLFNGSKNVSLVFTFRMSNNLIVQEAQDPGVNLLTETITSNVTEIEETVVSTKLDAVPETPVSYTEAAKRLGVSRKTIDRKMAAWSE